MSYNCTAMIVKKVSGFKIPLTWFFQKPDIDGIFLVQKVAGGCKQIIFGIAGFEFRGYLEEEQFVVVGVAKERNFPDGITPFLEFFFTASVGSLEVVFVWEGGDSIKKMKVDNGKIVYKDVEL